MVTPDTLMALAALLFIKHLAADGPLQTSYQVRYKGDFLHPGGLLHSSIHAFLTIVCLFAWVWIPASRRSAATSGSLWALPNSSFCDSATRTISWLSSGGGRWSFGPGLVTVRW